jgi:hypothetical protein
MNVKLATTLRLVILNVVLLVGLLAIAEFAARFAYPEFHAQIESASKTLGVNRYTGHFEGFPIRVPYAGYQPAAEMPLFLILGDSISNGYGMAYEDIYWVRLRRLVERTPFGGHEFLALAGYGNNLADSVKVLEAVAKNPALTIRFVLYQFNFNDIIPYGRDKLHDLGARAGVYAKLLRVLALWRYEFLNRFVFVRVMQHWAEMATSARVGASCAERGLDALGPYTWSYGSIQYKDEAERLWREFEVRLRDLKRASEALGARFAMFISPLLFDVDRSGWHPHFNHRHRDFSCATIDPRIRLGHIAEQLGVQLLDPAPYVERRFEARMAEQNFTPFFFAGDENHFTPVTAGYIAEYLATAISDAASDNGAVRRTAPTPGHARGGSEATR